ncbi:MAG TPA: hypothetical protein VL426_03130 [Candidatus Binatia bacterium]|nr:hypothetical protein [Candidatus Binatia bacterium]
MGTAHDAEERELLARLEDLLLPHVAYVGMGAAQAAVIQAALTPLPEDDIKTWSLCFAALALCDGATVGQAVREAKRVRAALRRPEPPTADEVASRARDVIRLETRALVRDWLGALEAHALHEGGTLSRASLDAAMLPPLPAPVAASFVDACARRVLGVGGTREALVLERMSLEDPDLCLPHDAIAYLELQGVAVVP